MKGNAILSHKSKNCPISLLLIFILTCMHFNVLGKVHVDPEKKDCRYDLKLTGNTTFDFGNSNNNIISNEIIDFLYDRDILNDLDLPQNQNGDYLGAIIMVSPDDTNIPSDFSLEGFITIFDQGGNYVPLKAKMVRFNNSLIYIWNMKDNYGHYVCPGIYKCCAEIKDVTPSTYPNGDGPIQTKRIMVAVKGVGSDCGGCGTSAELAFIPPIGFKIASMARRRKKWWQKLFERLQRKVKKILQ